MEHASEAATGAASLGHSIPWHPSAAVQGDRSRDAGLLRTGMPRVNLLLIGLDDTAWSVFEMLLVYLHGPVTTWSPPQHLALPPAERTGTMILNHVDALTPQEQLDLLDWLDHAAGRVQVVSTTSAALLPRVQAGAFLEALYYRLNVFCVDATA
jgi:sigma-54-interacting transcriptional regulator